MSDANKNVWPDKLRIRDTQLHDDIGGAGQRIYTTAGQGYEKREYIRADLVTAEIEQSQAIVKAAKELFRWHCMVEGGIVPDNAWTPLGNALFPGDPELTKNKTP